MTDHPAWTLAIRAAWTVITVGLVALYLLIW